MIGEWLAFGLLVLVAAVVLFLPGAVFGGVLRLRGLALVAFAPIATVAMVGALAIVLHLVRLPWSPFTFGLGALILCAIGLLVRRWLPALEPERWRRSRWLPLSIVIGAVLISIRLLLYIETPDAVSQTNDAVFHLNALRYVLETQSASSFSLTGVLGSSSFYPAAWHGVVTLVVQLTGAGIPNAVNAASLVIAALVWPVGIAWFTRAVTGSQVTAAVAATLSGVMVQFPMLMLQWGVLYPNTLAVGLLPGALAVIVGFGGTAAQADGRRGRLITVTLLSVVSIVALGLAQPVAALTLVILAGCFVFVRFAWQNAARAENRSRVWIGAGAVIGVLVVWYLIARASGGALWGPYGNWVVGLVEQALTAQVGLPPMPFLTILVLLGMVGAFWSRRARWLVAAWLGLALLMVIETSVANPLVRMWLLGPWYADPYRVAATLPVVMVPLMAIGLVWSARWAAVKIGVLRRGRGNLTAIVAGALIGIAVLVIHPVVQMPMITEGTVDSQSRYQIGRSTYLSTDERALIQQLPELVPAGATIIGNPSTGMGFAYALSGVNAIPRTWSPPAGDEWDLLAEHLRDAGSRKDVCAALEAFDSPTYVLDFGPGETTAGRYKMPGMTDLDGQPGFELVARKGAASLWRITACS
ncbi:DUF6541 family protein [Microbacterium sp. NPDC057650]|uniref:DUF6541 family protein n=1 Tax=unclassified Microbacterium TaxID=2609290 RepID=UPI00366C8088